MTSPAPVAVTIGDPAGIGPELSLKVAANSTLDSPVLLVGSADLLSRVADVAGIDVPVVVRESPADAVAEPGIAQVLDVPLDAEAIVPGAVSPQCGAAAVRAIEVATALALNGDVGAVASAPANKESFNAAGHRYEGQTEIFAQLTNTTTFHTMLVGGPMRVSLVSAHCSMREAIERVNAPRIIRILGELHAAMRDHFAVPDPRIGVAGLNPHAGENGVLGMEEIEQVRPALHQARERGIRVSDPLAADSLFAAAEAGDYDAVLAMYHDQGTIPLKRFGYVTYAAGLPIVRTTAGHGTAFDIAWQGVADPSLLERAVRLAAELGATAGSAGA